MVCPTQSSPGLLQFMISCSIKTGGGEGLENKARPSPSPVYDFLQYKNWRWGRPGNKAGPSPSPVYDLLQYENWRRGRSGNKTGPFPSPLYDLLQYKIWRQGRSESKAKPSQPPVYDFLQYENWRRGRPGNKAWRQGYSIQHSLVQYTIIGFRATTQTLTGQIHFPHTEEDSKGNS